MASHHSFRIAGVRIWICLQCLSEHGRSERPSRPPLHLWNPLAWSHFIWSTWDSYGQPMAASRKAQWNEADHAGYSLCRSQTSPFGWSKWNSYGIFLSNERRRKGLPFARSFCLPICASHVLHRIECLWIIGLRYKGCSNRRPCNLGTVVTLWHEKSTAHIFNS